MEFMCLIREAGGAVQCRFINENALDSGSHGAVEFLAPSPLFREWELLFHFNCLGRQQWIASRSWARVRGTPVGLEGLDSRARRVRMAPLALVRHNRSVDFVDLVHLIQTCDGFSGLRLFRTRLAAIGRMPQDLFPAVGERTERYHDGEYEFLWILI